MVRRKAESKWRVLHWRYKACWVLDIFVIVYWSYKGSYLCIADVKVVCIRENWRYKFSCILQTWRWLVVHWRDLRSISVQVWWSTVGLWWTSASWCSSWRSRTTLAATRRRSWKSCRRNCVCIPLSEYQVNLLLSAHDLWGIARIIESFVMLFWEWLFDNFNLSYWSIEVPWSLELSLLWYEFLLLKYWGSAKLCVQLYGSLSVSSVLSQGIWMMTSTICLSCSE